MSKSLFLKGAISPEFIADSIRKHQSKHDIGAHEIFLGQVRADTIKNATVISIDYTAYEEMANEKMSAIREETFGHFPISCMHVYHSLGKVAVGEICLFVFTSSPHRQVAKEANSYLVERIKKELPIWGQELFNEQEGQWKVNN